MTTHLLRDSKQAFKCGLCKYATLRYWKIVSIYVCKEDIVMGKGCCWRVVRANFYLLFGGLVGIRAGRANLLLVKL